MRVSEAALRRSLSESGQQSRRPEDASHTGDLMQHDAAPGLMTTRGDFRDVGRYDLKWESRLDHPGATRPLSLRATPPSQEGEASISMGARVWGENDFLQRVMFTSGGLYFSTFSKASAMRRVSTSSTASAPAWDR